MPDDNELSKLVRELEDEDEFDRAEAALALGQLGDKRAAEPLINALEDEDEDVRGHAASALAVT